MKNLGTLCILLMLPLISNADAAATAQERCGGCHQLTPPTGNGEIPALNERAAPPLHYAGNKFRRDWLEAWLQQPVRIRPAGYYPPAHTVSDANGDVVDAESLPAHPALAADQARQVTEYLMGLRSREDLIAADGYEPGTIALRMGMMDFRRFKGCNACHQDAPDTGGISGPQLFSAWERLQPSFISSYISDPTAWDPHGMMPVQEMNEGAVHKLVDYLKAIGEQ